MGVAGALLEEYGADGLGFEDEESSLSVSEFKYAVYSGNVWSEYVELDEEECVFRSNLKSVYLVLFISDFVLFCIVSLFTFTFSFNTFFPSTFGFEIKTFFLSAGFLRK